MVPTNCKTFSLMAPMTYLPVIVMGRAHTLMRTCLFMFAQGKEGIGTKLKNVGDLIPFTAPPGDVKLQEQSIGSPIPSRTSFR